MIGKKERVLCGWCGRDSSAEEWNNLTYSCCTNREMKRSYLEIYKEKAFGRRDPKFYKCPKCGTWSQGSQLRIVNTKDERLLRLGGDPVYKIK